MVLAVGARAVAVNTSQPITFSESTAESAVALAQSPLLAQSSVASPFPAPSAVPSGTQIRLDGSPSMTVINQSLKNQFQTQFSGTTVNLAATGTREALQALQNDQIDIAAVGRGLTAEEKAQGLTEYSIGREKIAIIIGPDNPFQGDITFQQFARIFRGEITDWSELGGEPGPIRLVDRPESSDTRQSLSTYQVFQDAPFQAGSTADAVGQDDTAAVVQALGRDGIGYAIANQVLNQSNVRIVPMHKTLPDDPRYPYSQPRGYVYRQDNPAVQAFLGFVGSPEGQTALQNGRLAEAAAVAAAGAAGATVGSSPSPTVGSSPAVTTSPSPAAGASSPIAPATGDTTALAPGTAPGAATDAGTRGGFPGWLWWLLLPLLGGLFWWLFKRGSSEQQVGAVPPREPIAAGRIPEPPASAVNQGRDRLPDRPINPPAASNTAATRSPSTPGNSSGRAISGIAAGAAGAAGIAGAAALANRWRENRLTLTSRGSGAEARWEVPQDHKLALRQQGGQKMMLRLYDVTDIDMERQIPHNVKQFDCDETASSLQIPITQGDRDYIGELGYVTADSRWLKLARSAPLRMPPLPNAGTAIAAAAATGAAVVATGIAARADTNRTGEDEAALVRQSYINLVPRNAQEAYASWDVPDAHKALLRKQGGRKLQLRIYDATDIDLDQQPAHRVQVYDGNEIVHNKLVPIPVPDRDYVAEVGYATDDGRWLKLARSTAVRIPPQSGESGINPLGAAGAAAVMGAVVATQGRSQPLPDAIPPAAPAEDRSLAPDLEPSLDLSSDLEANPAAPLVETEETEEVVEPAAEPAAEPVEAIAEPASTTTSTEGTLTTPVIGAVVGTVAGAAGLGLANATPVEVESSEPVSAIAPTEPSSCHITTLRVHSRANCFMLDPEQMKQIQDQVAVTKELAPGNYLIRIKSGGFHYQPIANQPGEPIVLLWIYGGQVINRKTNVPVRATWSTLNGYADTLNLQVLEPAILCAFFLDTYVEDNGGELTLSTVKL